MINPIVVEKFEIYDAGKPTERKVRKHYYWCPGCDTLHGLAISPSKNGNGAGWTFTGTLEKPTYHPSQRTSYAQRIDGKAVPYQCHTFIRDGMIQYLSDCTHRLAGQTVPLPPLPDWAM